MPSMICRRNEVPVWSIRIIKAKALLRLDSDLGIGIVGFAGLIPERGEECKRGIANDQIVTIGRAGHRANPTIDILVFAD